MKHSKKSKDSGRDRDKNKAVASESGGSSQCDTPPLMDKVPWVLFISVVCNYWLD